MKDKKITAMELKGDIHKGVSYSGKGFRINVVYTTEDGAKVESAISAQRKKNVPAAIDRKRESIAAGSMSVTPTGMISERFTIGRTANGMGLVPDAS